MATMAQNPKRQFNNRAVGILRKGNELFRLRGAGMFIIIHFNSEWWRYSSDNFNSVLMNEDIEARKGKVWPRRTALSKQPRFSRWMKSP